MTTVLDIPLIDISTEDNHAAGKAMLEASMKYGFLYIDSRSSFFTRDDVSRTFDLSKEFFQLPRTEKARYRRQADNKGWVGMMDETLDPEHHKRGDFKEALNIGELHDGKLNQSLPLCVMRHENDISHFINLCNRTCARVLELLAYGLEVPSDFFTSQHDSSKGPTGNSLRLLYYPEDVAGYSPGLDIRAGAHSDYGSITLLFQRPGQPGLEILTNDQKWAPVPIYPGGVDRDYPFPPILVNIGDMLSYWTDGLLKSTVHRVVFPEGNGDIQRCESRDRYSIAFFCQPVETTELGPIPSELVTSYRQKMGEEDAIVAVGYGGGAQALNTSQRRTITAKEHLQARLAATYV